MEEVVDLQQQQRRVAHRAGEVNQRLLSAEQRQKQMVSFLAKLFQNPAFLACLRQKKEQREIESPRVVRKFVKQHPHETGTAETLQERQIVRYQPDWKNIEMSYETPEVSPVSIEQSPHYLSQGLAGELSVGAEEDFTAPVESVVPDDLAAPHGIMPSQEMMIGEGSSPEDPLFKGKGVMSPNLEAPPEYFASFPEALAKDKGFLDFSSLGTEGNIKLEDMWDSGLNVSGPVSSIGNEMWDNPINYEVLQEFGVTSGMSESDLWDIGSGSLGIDKWPADELSLGEADDQAGQPKEDRPKNMDP